MSKYKSILIAETNRTIRNKIIPIRKLVLSSSLNISFIVFIIDFSFGIVLLVDSGISIL